MYRFLGIDKHVSVSRDSHVSTHPCPNPALLITCRRLPSPTDSATITRATAEHLLAGVIERAQTFNTDGSHVVDIVEVADEALLILGNRTAAINITLENVRTLTDRWEVAYTYDA